MSKDNPNYIRIWASALEPILDTASSVILFGVLASKFEGEGGVSFAAMSRWTGLSRGTILRSLQKLEGEGFLKRIRRGKTLTSVYHIGPSLEPYAEVVLKKVYS